MTAAVAMQCGQICANCPGKARKLAQWGLLLVGAIAISLIVAIFAMAVTPDAAPLCHYEGRSFSVGSLIIVAGNQGRECRTESTTPGASWFPVHLTGNNKDDNKNE